MKLIAKILSLVFQVVMLVVFINGADAEKLIVLGVSAIILMQVGTPADKE